MRQTRTVSTDPGNDKPADAGHDGLPADLVPVWKQWQSVPKEERGNALIHIYNKYSANFLSDNARIWTTAASMIPLSLGAFVVLASIRRPTLLEVVILSAAAWILMSVWLVIAENHRALQEGSQRVILEIEQIWEFPSRPAKSNGGWLTGSQRVRKMRFLLWWTVTIGAIVTVLFWPGGVVSHV